MSAVDGPRAGAGVGHSLVFYDGTCGLCHRAVRFALARDADGSRFRFAPLDSEAFRQRVPDAAGLPDSMVVRTPEGSVLVRSAGVIHILERAGGGESEHLRRTVDAGEPTRGTPPRERGTGSENRRRERGSRCQAR